MQWILGHAASSHVTDTRATKCACRTATSSTNERHQYMLFFQ